MAMTTMSCPERSGQLDLAQAKTMPVQRRFVAWTT